MANQKIGGKEKLYNLLYILLIIGVVLLTRSDNPRVSILFRLITPFVSAYVVYDSIRSFLNSKSIMVKIGRVLWAGLFFLLLLNSLLGFVDGLRTIFL